MRINLKDNRILYLQAILMGLLPLVYAVVFCAMQGGTLGQVYLPASEWNDELFYFKQVESMLEYGYPQGYFGFNESHALKLSFAAWSPVLVWPWLVLGKLFGWTIMSPIYYNILMVMLTMAGFVLIVRPTWKQLGLLTLLFCTYTPFGRYMLCGMPEIICFCMLIIYFAVMVRYMQSPGRATLIWLIVLASVMTLMRPYLILFLLYPLGVLVLEKKWKGGLLSVGILGVVAVIYWSINHYLSAEYFTPLFKTEWLQPFFKGQFAEGIKGILVNLYYNGSNFKNLMIEGFYSGIYQGIIFAGFMAMLLLFAFQFVVDFVKKNKKHAYLYGYLTFCFFAMLIAILLMYKVMEGSRHFLTFMALGIFVVALMETKFYKKAVFLGALCVFLYYIQGMQIPEFQIPFSTEECTARQTYWQEVFEERLELCEENTPNYDNVIIWTLSDAVEDTQVATKWQVLYEIPTGYGISCCYSDYIIENFESLQSRYISVPTGGTIAQMCDEAGKTLIGADENVSVYELR